MDPNKKYEISLNAEQADLLVKALDLFTRIGLGQFEAVLEAYDRDLKLPLEKRELITSGLNTAKLAAGHPVNGSFGINNPAMHEKFRDTWDICQVVRHRLAWDRKPEGGPQVWFDRPYRAGALPLITITAKEG